MSRGAHVTALLLAFSLLSLANPVYYTVIPLGTLGGTYTSATAVNDSGQVAGSSLLANGVQHAFLYTAGAMVDLGTLTGPVGGFSEALGLNDSGQVTGDSQTAAGLAHAFLYRNGAMTDLGPFTAFAINATGQITGVSNLFSRAVLDSGGTILSLRRAAAAGHTSCNLRAATSSLPSPRRPPWLASGWPRWRFSGEVVHILREYL